MKLTIDRSKWLRGEGGDASKLLRSSDGKMCCLGFYALAKGATESQIRDTNTIAGVHGLAKLMPEMCRYEKMASSTNDSAVAADLMWKNDCLLTDSEREANIVSIFKEVGVEVEFIN